MRPTPAAISRSTSMPETSQSNVSSDFGADAPRPGEVRVWRWSLLTDDRRLGSLRSLLSADERERADRLVKADIARRWIVARAGLRRLLGEALAVAPDALTFEYGPLGKPQLTSASPSPCPPLHFNLAHSGDEAVLAVAGAPVGIDLERVRPMPRLTAFAERWFHPRERERLAAATDADRLAAFFRVWTAKEAALKLLGRGVGDALPRLLTPDAEGDAAPLPANDLGADRCRITRRDETECFVAIATAEPPAGVVSHRLG